MDPFLSIPESVAPFEPGQLHVWRLHLAPLSASLAGMGAMLSPEERVRAARLRFENDRLRYVAAHAGLRLVLAAYLGCEPKAVGLETGALGKPLLAGPVPLKRCPETAGEPTGDAASLTFNLSHSGEWGLLAIGCRDHIGVDVEARRGLPDLAELAQTVLSSKELAVLQARDPQRQLECFFQMWTRKEAIVKATGAGIGSAFAEIEIEPADPAAGDAFRVTAGLSGMPQLFGLSFTPAVDYWGAVVCEAALPQVLWRDWPELHSL